MASGDDQKTSTTKKATARKRAAKQAVTGTDDKKDSPKPGAKKSTRSPSAAEKRNAGTSTPQRARSAPRVESRPRPSAPEIGRLALQQLGTMTGTSVESITGLQRTEDGWTVEAVAVELRRIPNTTDVLASYEVLLDADGELQGYRRLERYSRGDTRSDQ